jgi:hypothetical protein
LTGRDRSNKEVTIMTRLPLTSLALATVCLTAIAVTAPARAQQAAVPAQLVTNGPQFTPGDAADRAAAERNLRESAEYEGLLRTNPAFRALRIQQECGPISDPQLQASCIGSFPPAEYAATPPRHRHYSQTAKTNNG